MTGRAPPLRLPREPLVAGATALRPWREDDLDDLVRLCADPEIARWIRIPIPYRAVDGRAFLAGRREAVAAGLSAPFAVTDAASGRLLGSVALGRIDRAAARAEIGYWLGAEGRGRGHATRAVEVLCAWGHGTLGLRRITLYAATGNLASQAVAERAGFRREAILRSWSTGREGRIDMVAFGRLLP